MKKLVLIGIFVAGALTACFSPWKGDEATLIINLGGGSSGRSAIKWPQYDSDEGTFINPMEYSITLDGPSGVITETLRFEEKKSVADAKFAFSVVPGTYRIELTICFHLVG